MIGLRLTIVLTPKGLVVKEENFIRLIYLATVSRLLKARGDLPVSVIAKGSSAGGKSHVIIKVLSMFNEGESWRLVSMMSDRALVRDQRSYKHLVIFMPEVDQLQEKIVARLRQNFGAEIRDK